MEINVLCMNTFSKNDEREVRVTSRKTDLTECDLELFLQGKIGDLKRLL